MNFLRNRSNNQNNKVKILGTINPIKWNDEGKPTEFSLYTPEEEDILLIGKNCQRKLKRHLNQLVEVTGSFLEDQDNEDIKKLMVSKVKKKKIIPEKTKKHKRNNYPDSSYIADWKVSLPHLAGRFELQL